MSLSYPRQRVRPCGRIPVIGKRTKVDYTYFNGNLVSVNNRATLYSGPYYRGSEVCNDYLTVQPPFEDHDLTITKKSLIKQGLINGVMLVPATKPKTGTQSLYKYYNWSDYTVADVTKPHLSSIPSVDWATLKNRALGRININRPHFDSLNFLLELRDFPGMLKHAGDLLESYLKFRQLSKKSFTPAGYTDYVARHGGGARTLAELHLAYGFGWRPFVSDLYKLNSIAFAIDGQLRLLTDIKQGRRIRISLGSTGEHEVYQETVTPINFPNQSLAISSRDLLKEEFWATFHTERKDLSNENWYSRLMQLGSIRPEDWRPSSRKAWGLGLSAASLWKSYPWTWLIDYFVSIGDMLDATRGVLPYSVTRMCLMARQLVTNSTTELFNQTPLKYRPSLMYSSGKSRKRYINPTPEVVISLPLSVGQLSNLLALGTLGKLTSLARTA